MKFLITEGWQKEILNIIDSVSEILGISQSRILLLDLWSICTSMVHWPL